MGLKKKVLQVILFIINLCTRLFPIHEKRIVFVSLEANILESDLKLIHDALEQDNSYTLKCILMKYDQKSLKNNFMYLLNTMKQIWYINRSRLVLINDNNFVISNFKRKGVIVIQVWHAMGAIKKFGNTVKREYTIQNYDYVLVNSDFWKEPYHQAFDVPIKNIKVTGLPRVDPLLEKEYIEQSRSKLLKKYPILQGRKVILYAPTFRGNIYQGFRGMNIDCDKIMQELGKDYIFIYKLHPLLKDNRLQEAKYAYNMNHEDTHELFTIADILISDYSSVIFDFSLLERPIILFAPDKKEYSKDVGTFLDYDTLIPGNICINEKEIIQCVQKEMDMSIIKTFKDRFFTYQDGKNLSRVISFINEIMKT